MDVIRKRIDLTVDVLIHHNNMGGYLNSIIIDHFKNEIHFRSFMQDDIGWANLYLLKLCLSQCIFVESFIKEVVYPYTKNIETKIESIWSSRDDLKLFQSVLSFLELLFAVVNPIALSPVHNISFMVIKFDSYLSNYELKL